MTEYDSGQGGQEEQVELIDVDPEDEAGELDRDMSSLVRRADPKSQLYLQTDGQD